jgi:phenylacetate-CoA ligase
VSLNPLGRLSVYRALRPLNARTRQDIDEFRDRKIRKLVRHAYANVPYYRKLFDQHGVDANEIRTAQDLSRIPVSSRTDIQLAKMSDRLARGVDAGQLIVRKTTGSSGQCLEVMRTWAEEQKLNLMRWRAIRGYGLKRADVIAVPRIPIGRHHRDYALPRRIADAIGFYRKELIDLSTIEDASRILILREPEVIMGWPTILGDLAPKWRAMRTTKTRGPKFLISGGEMLAPHVKKRITEDFEAPVYDMMGAHEFSLLAWECPVTAHYHFSDETIYAQVVVDGRVAEPGEQGELVVTGLHSMAMPFIRYNLGDIVVQGSSECECGSPFSTMRAMQGRTGEYFNLPEGRRVHPQDIVRMSFIAASWIRNLQVVQNDLTHLELHIVPDRQPSNEEIDKIRAAVKKVLWGVATLEVSIVPEIPVSYDTKFRVHRSLLDSRNNMAGTSHHS